MHLNPSLMPCWVFFSLSTDFHWESGQTAYRKVQFESATECSEVVRHWTCAWMCIQDPNSGRCRKISPDVEIHDQDLSLKFVHKKEWDVGLPSLVCAAGDSVHESLGCYSLFQLVFGNRVWGILRSGLLKDGCLEKEPVPVHAYVREMEERLRAAINVAHENLGISHDKMKETYDPDTAVRSFKVGDRVLALIPSPNNPVHTTFVGPCTVDKNVDNRNYVITTPERRKAILSYFTLTCWSNIIHVRGKLVLKAPTLAMSSLL